MFCQRSPVDATDGVLFKFGGHLTCLDIFAFPYIIDPSAISFGCHTCRALRNVVSWKHGLCRIHVLVAARAFRNWEMTHAREANLLTTLLEKKADKLFRFEVGEADVPSAVFKASELRRMYDGRIEEAKVLLDSLTAKDAYAHGPLVELTSGSLPENERRATRESSAAAAAASPPSPSLVQESVIDGRRTLQDTGDRNATRDRRASRVGALITTGSDAVNRTGTPAPCRAVAHTRGWDAASGGRKRISEIQSFDGTWYTLPRFVRVNKGRLGLIVSLNRYMVDGELLYSEGTPRKDTPLQKGFGWADITVDNVLVLRCVLRGGAEATPG